MCSSRLPLLNCSFNIGKKGLFIKNLHASLRRTVPHLINVAGWVECLEDPLTKLSSAIIKPGFGSFIFSQRFPELNEKVKR